MEMHIKGHEGLLNGRLFGIPPYEPTHKDDDQLTLFDADALSRDARGRAAGRLAAGVKTADPDITDFMNHVPSKQQEHAARMNQQTVRGTLSRSKLPTELLDSLQGSIIAFHPTEANLAGVYSNGTGKVGIRARADRTLIGGFDNSYTLTHELGHRADFRSSNVERTSIRSLPTDMVDRAFERHFLGREGKPHPRIEGWADGFMDRYSHYDTRDVGYTPETWESPEDKAVYTATRAHASHTGERVTGGSYGEYMYRMLATSPHARDALANSWANKLNDWDALDYDTPDDLDAWEYDTPEINPRNNEQIKAALNAAKDYADTRALSIQHPLPLRDSRGRQVGRTVVTRDIPAHVSGGLSHDQFLRAMRHWGASRLDHSKFDSERK